MAIRIGTFGNDLINGTDFDDTFFGLTGNDVMNGGRGNDTFYDGTGADTFNGGDGIDTVDFSAALPALESITLGTLTLNGVFVNLTSGEGSAISNLAEIDHFNSIENVTGSAFNDGLVGSDVANTLRGGGGDDAIEGRGGADTLDGGDGIDTLSYAGSDAGVRVNLQANTASGGDATGDVISNFENVIGSQFADRLTGSSGANLFVGGGGNDILTGGLGADTFHYTGGVNNGTDHITDFNWRQGDRIEFDAAPGEHVQFNIGNINIFTGTASVDVTLGSSGHVVLDNISLFDIQHVEASVFVI